MRARGGVQGCAQGCAQITASPASCRPWSSCSHRRLPPEPHTPTSHPRPPTIPAHRPQLHLHVAACGRRQLEHVVVIPEGDVLVAHKVHDVEREGELLMRGGGGVITGEREMRGGGGVITEEGGDNSVAMVSLGALRLTDTSSYPSPPAELRASELGRTGDAHLWWKVADIVSSQ